MIGQVFYGPARMHMGMGWFGGLLWVLLFAVLVGLLAWAIVSFAGHRHDGGHLAGAAPPAPPLPTTPPLPPPGWGPARDDALNTARIRYARGELDREQYFRVVEDLTGVPRPASPPAWAYPPPATAPPAPDLGPTPEPPAQPGTTTP